MFKIIPEKVLYDPELSPLSKLIVAEIASFSINSMDCFTRNETWAERFGVSKRTVSRCVSELVEKGYVIRKILYRDDSKEIWKRVLVVSRDVIYSLGEVAVGVKKHIEFEQVEAESQEYRPTDFMKNFNKLFEK